jgi:CO/xanthine dehydrogenase FAD-binding subunit
VRPAGLTDALRLVAAGGTPVGGGAALLSPAFPCRLGAVAVDLAAVLPAGVDGDVVGAGTTLGELAADPGVRARWGAVAAAAAGTATPQVRAVATLGGTVAARLPAADLPAALAVHGGLVRVLTAGGVRELPVAGYAADGLAEPHLVVGVRLTVPGPGTTHRFALRTGPAPALAVVAGVRTGSGVALAAGAVGRDPAPLPFGGDAPPPGLLRDDARASAAYRSRLVAVLADAVREELTR